MKTEGKSCPGCGKKLKYLGEVRDTNQLKYLCESSGQIWRYDHVFLSWERW